MEIKFDKKSLDVKQRNYLTKILYAQIVYDLGTCPKIQLRNFTRKNRLFRETSIVKNSDKEKYVYTGY